MFKHPKVFRQLQWCFRAGFSCKLSWEKESRTWLSTYSKLLLPAGVGEKKNQGETCQLFIFWPREGCRAVIERYHFEKLFFPGLWHLLCFTNVYICKTNTKYSRWKGRGGLRLVPSSAQTFGKPLTCTLEAAANGGGSSWLCVGTTCCPGEGT